MDNEQTAVGATGGPDRLEGFAFVAGPDEILLEKQELDFLQGLGAEIVNMETALASKPLVEEGVEFGWGLRFRFSFGFGHR